MRIALPFVVPLACLLGILVVPDQAAPLSAALVASIITLGLAAPALFSASESAATSASTTKKERLNVSAPEALSRVSWAKTFWWAGVALEVAAVVWTFVSLGGLVIAPEDAQSWSLHLGGSMLLVMFWTPLIVFIRPSDADQSASQELAPKEEEAQDFVPEAEKQLRTSVSSRVNQKAEERSLWEFGGGDGDSFESGNTPDVAAGSAGTDQRDHAQQEVGPDTSEMWAAAWPDDDPEPATAGPSQADASPANASPAATAAPDTSNAREQKVDEHAERRSLWSFPDDDDDSSTTEEAAATPRELEAAQKAATAPWGDDTSGQEEEMAWDILESILEEEESRSSDDEGGGSWEPDEWPDFNYDV